MTLTDPRVKKQAKILVNYSIKLKKKDNVIVSGDFEAKPLIYEIYRLLIKGGAGEVMNCRRYFSKTQQKHS
jgi:aminopeptidase